MTNKQKRFCDEYLIDCNAKAAYIRAGYKNFKSAGVEALKMMNKPEIKSYIQEHLEQISSEKIADAKEVMEYLTSVMRGDAIAHEVVILGKGNGITEAVEMPKHPSEAERIRAAELLAKRYGLLTGKLEIIEPVQVILVDDVVE